MMNFRKDAIDEESRMDASLGQTLRDFRSSVHAWSEAAYNQPHRRVKVYRTSWRMTAGWALGCLLAMGSVGGGLYERHHAKEQARVAAAAEAARQKQLEDQQLRENEDLLAKVDSDVSRDVPSAMEPLAQLMAEDNSQ
jgi:hypothetical protein